MKERHQIQSQNPALAPCNQALWESHASKTHSPMVEKGLFWESE